MPNKCQTNTKQNAKQDTTKCQTIYQIIAKQMPNKCQTNAKQNTKPMSNN